MSEDAKPTGNKVARVIREYGLEGLGDELERRWTADGDERDSLRELATVFNVRVLDAALEAHDQQPTMETVERTYHLLTDDADVATRNRIERDLERAGVDVASLRADFVSHQAIHTFLTRYRDVAPPENESNPEETAVRAINRLQSRTAAVTESNIDRLVKKGTLGDRDVEVLVNVTVLCNECGTSHPVGEYIQSGGCDCAGSNPPADR